MELNEVINVKKLELGFGESDTLSFRWQDCSVGLDIAVTGAAGKPIWEANELPIEVIKQLKSFCDYVLNDIDICAK